MPSISSVQVPDYVSEGGLVGCEPVFQLVWMFGRLVFAWLGIVFWDKP